MDDLCPLRVLVVDDGDAASRVVEQLTDGVEDGRYIVARATTLTDGLAAIIEEEHDVCVVDHHIGFRTGFDLLASITTEEIDVPVVFVTESGDHGTGVTAVGAGASCYIVEDSIGSEHLDRCLRQAVEERLTLSRLVGAGVAIDGGTPTKAQIFSHIAERLGGPASAILESTRSSLGSQIPDHVAESLAVIEDQVATILTLAHDIDDLSMLESGSLRFDSTPFSLRGLVAGVKRVVVTMEHCNRKGDPKILESCTLPLTGKECVDMIITDLCVMQMRVNGDDRAYEVIELADGVTADEVREKTPARITFADNLQAITV